MPPVTTITVTVRLGSPVEHPISLTPGEVAQIDLVVLDADGDPQDVTGWAFVLGMRSPAWPPQRNSSARYLPREFTITDNAGGAASAPIVTDDTLGWVPGGYLWDLWAIDPDGNPTQVVLESTATLRGSAYHPLDEVTVPPSQAPLAVGPAGPAGPKGDPGPQGDPGPKGDPGSSADLSDYVTNEALASSLASYVTSGALTSALTGYVPTSRRVKAGSNVAVTGGGGLAADQLTADLTIAVDLSAYVTSSSLASSLAGYVPTSRTLTAGTGLSGGGDLSANRSLAIADTAVTPGTYAYASVTVDQQGRLTAASAGATPALASRALTAGTGLSGGGDLSADRTFNLANTAVAAGSYTYASLTVDAQGRLTAASNGVTPAVATRLISAGTGLSGGGDLSADRTISLANTAVSAGSYTYASITVDAQGRLTAASSGTAPVLPTRQVLAGGDLTGGGELSGDVTITLPNTLTAKTLKGLTVAPDASTGTPATALVITPAAHTSLTASTEQMWQVVNAQTYSWATGALALQRFNCFNAPTLAFASASTATATFNAWMDAPVAGTNATLTLAAALGLSSGVAATYNAACDKNAAAANNNNLVAFTRQGSLKHKIAFDSSDRLTFVASSGTQGYIFTSATGNGVLTCDDTAGCSMKYTGSGVAQQVKVDSANVTLAAGSGAVAVIKIGAATIGFFNTTPASKQTVTGSRGGNAAVASFLTALATMGLITDSTTA